MKALSLLPPDFNGVERGCGSSEFAFVIVDDTDEGGGERMKPPDWAGGVDIAGKLALRSSSKLDLRLRIPQKKEAVSLIWQVDSLALSVGGSCQHATCDGIDVKSR